MYSYRNSSYGMNNKNYPNYVYDANGERFFWAPFVVGGTNMLVHINGKVDMYAKLYIHKEKT